MTFGYLNLRQVHNTHTDRSFRTHNIETNMKGGEQGSPRALTRHAPKSYEG